MSSGIAARDAAANRAQQKAKEQEELLALLEGQIKSAREASAMQIEQLNAQLQREQIERAMAEGALESGRKDIARLIREISERQRPTETAATASPTAAPPAAGAATPGKSNLSSAA
jgi:chromosome segregation ATPase